MLIKKILVGVDGSTESREAITFAAKIAKAANASMLLVYVVEPRDAARQLPPELDIPEHSYAAALLRDLEGECLRRGVPVESRTASGPVAAALSSMAQTEAADLAVVGHRGRGAVVRAILGSVADKLVQICQVPVLVVR